MLAIQQGWRWCSRCQVLVYSGFGNGICYDGQPHHLNDSGRYSVPMFAGEADRTVHRFAIATFLFRSVLPPEQGGAGILPWSHDLLNEVFVNHEYSIRNYWRRATFGLVDLQFDIVTHIYCPFEEFSQADANGRGGRDRTVEAARQYLRDNDISIDGYDHLIAVVPNTPTDAGATGQGGDIAFDLAGATLPFLQHEVGHTLGFQHAFGPFIPPPDVYGSLYNDAYCVMGYTGQQAHSAQEPPQFAGLTPADFWISERRISGASLWRHSEAFRLSGRATHVLDPLGGHVQIFGLCSNDARPMSQVAVVPRPRHQGQYVIAEYRPALGDDFGVTPQVVVHSIGANYVGDGRSEVSPAWLETTIPASPGAVANVDGVRFTVTAVSATPPESVEVNITLVPMPD